MKQFSFQIKPTTKRSKDRRSDSRNSMRIISSVNDPHTKHCKTHLFHGAIEFFTVLLFLVFSNSEMNSSPNKKIITKNDHNELANHWSDVVRLGLNPVDSDNTCKILYSSFDI